MTCAEARDLLLERARRRLAAGALGEVEAHLATCEACAREAEAEAELDALLTRRPRYPASPELRRHLVQLTARAVAGDPAREGVPAGRTRAWLAAALAAGFALTTGALVLGRTTGGGPRQALVTEAVNDHLRVLVRDRPVEVESSGRHEVKPWFEGRLDFAPVVPDGGKHELRLVGGSVGYFGERRAAMVSYALRKHRVTLLAFRADGLALPAGNTGAGSMVEAADRGFEVFLWRAGSLGYALVSDAGAVELRQIAADLAAQTSGAESP